MDDLGHGRRAIGDELDAACIQQIRRRRAGAMPGKRARAIMSGIWRGALVVMRRRRQIAGMDRDSALRRAEDQGEGKLIGGWRRGHEPGRDHDLDRKRQGGQHHEDGARCSSALIECPDHGAALGQPPPIVEPLFRSGRASVDPSAHRFTVAVEQGDVSSASWRDPSQLLVQSQDRRLTSRGHGCRVGGQHEEVGTSQPCSS